MHMDTYNAIMQYEDQFITCRSTLNGLQIAIMSDDKETIDAVTAIARSNSLKLRKIVVGKGDPDAEMHLTIR